jgi:hypothetical protein
MELVLIHFSQKLPKYAKKNLLLLQEMFPNLTKTMITDVKKNENIAAKYRFKSELISINSTQFAEIDKYHDPAFRNGFWFTSFYRLIALCDYAISKNQPIIHIENDILLAPNFPFGAISRCDKPMWFQFNEERDVAAIIYLPNRDIATWLKEEMIEKFRVNPSHTDMTILREIASENPEKVDYFPIAESANSEIFRNDVSASARAKNSQEFEKFSGLFDSAPMGMYFLGRDPRNHRGTLVRFSPLPEAFVRAEKSHFNYSHKNMALRINQVDFPLHNLHIHSKLPNVFTLNGLNSFVIGERGMRNGIRKTISIRVLVKLLISFFRRHKFRAFARLVAELKLKLWPK